MVPVGRVAWSTDRVDAGTASDAAVRGVLHDGPLHLDLVVGLGPQQVIAHVMWNGAPLEIILKSSSHFSTGRFQVDPAVLKTS